MMEQYKKALKCLYLEVDPRIAKDVESKVEEKIQSLQKELEAAQAKSHGLCDSCGGDATPNCSCGGDGTAESQRDYIRKKLVETRQELEAVRAELEEMQEPMECGHFQANLQPCDEGPECCIVCTELSQVKAENDRHGDAWGIVSTPIDGLRPFSQHDFPTLNAEMFYKAQLDLIKDEMGKAKELLKGG